MYILTIGSIIFLVDESKHQTRNTASFSIVISTNSITIVIIFTGHRIQLVVNMINSINGYTICSINVLKTFNALYRNRPFLKSSIRINTSLQWAVWLGKKETDFSKVNEGLLNFINKLKTHVYLQSNVLSSLKNWQSEISI